MNGVNFLLEERELRVIANNIINSKSLKIKAIKFFGKEEKLTINILFKKVFALDARIILKLKNISEKKVILEIVDIYSMKVNLFSVMEKTMKGKNIDRFKNKGIIIRNKEIIIDNNKLLQKINLDEAIIKDIKILNNGLMVKFSQVNEDKLLGLKNIS